MAPSEKFKDWQFRYQYMFGVRKSEKSKMRFIGALLTDLSQLGATPKIIEFDKQKNSASRNIYVGDFNKAKKIICTYYDTPMTYLSDYILFDRQEQSRKTIKSLLVNTILLTILGLIGIYILIQANMFSFEFNQFKTYVSIALLMVYFIIFGRVAKGMANRRNLVRNTSSLLLMLDMIEKTNNENIAFAFIDEGSIGERGLQVLREDAPRKTPIYLLDSIGADTTLYCKSNEVELLTQKSIHDNKNAKINYIFCGEQKEDIYYLPKNLLRKKELNMENLSQLLGLFS